MNSKPLEENAMSVTVIRASKWEIKEGAFDVNLHENHPCTLSANELAESLAEIENRPEMAELDRELMKSPAYFAEKKQ